MPQTSSKTGRGGYFTLDGTAIAITKMTPTTTKETADSTDSNDYDAGTGQLWKSQKPGALSQEVSIEFNYDTANTPTGITAKLKADPVVAAVLKIDRSTTYCSGNYDLTEVEINVEIPGATMITGTAKLMSNGPITFA